MNKEIVLHYSYRLDDKFLCCNHSSVWGLVFLLSIVLVLKHSSILS